MLLAKTTVVQNEDMLSYHRVCGLYFLVIFLRRLYIAHYCHNLTNGICP